MTNKIWGKYNQQKPLTWDPIVAKLIERAHIGQLLKNNGISDNAINELWNWYDHPKCP